MFIFTSKKKRRILNYFFFFRSCFCTLIGLFSYLLGKYFLHFPNRWLTSELGGEKFFLGIRIHSFVNFLSSFIFLPYNLYKKKNSEYFELKKWKEIVSKILIFFFIIVTTLSKYLKYTNNKIDIFVIIFSSILINYHLINIIIQMMNKYGICNAFSIIFIVDQISSLEWIKKTKYSNLLILFLFTFFYTWISNIKWEVPVETNRFYGKNIMFDDSISFFSLKTNFNFFSLFQLSWLISSISNIRNIISTIINSEKSLTVFEKLKLTMKLSVSPLKRKLVDFSDNLITSKNFLECFFLLNEKGKIFLINDIKENIKNVNFFLALFFLLLLRWLVNWFQIKQLQWNPSEISEDLRKNGIYIVNIRYGRDTERVLSRNINELINFCFFLNLILNFFFDYSFSGQEFYSLNFISWFSNVNLAINILKQIKSKKNIQIENE